MTNRVLLILSIFIIGCKPYYNSHKKYGISEGDLLRKTSLIDLSNPIKLNFSGLITDAEKDYKINGFIKIESREHYQIVIYSRTFGIEIGRVEVNKDSILLVDKIGKRFYSGEINGLIFLNSLGLNGTDYLKLFIGRSLNYEKFSKDALSEYSYTYKCKNLKGNIVVNNFGFLKIYTVDSDEFKLDIEYFNYWINYDIPSKVVADLKLKKTNYNIEFNFSDVSKFDSQLVKFVIPNGYNKIL